MKKTLLFITFFLIASQTYADVIFTPIEYSGISYSLEAVSSSEKTTSSYGTTALWAGAGTVGSFFFINMPFWGVEISIEKRHYFKPKTYKGLFISAYMGIALMTDLHTLLDFGLVPGVKLNYKIRPSKNFAIEPYVGLSVPFAYCLTYNGLYFPLPVLTLGVRFGFNSVKR